MNHPTLVLLYVQNPAASAAFYSKLLGRPALESSENWAMLPLGKELMLGLWSTEDAKPQATCTGGGSEINFPEGSPEAVDLCHQEWAARGVHIAQEPTKMDFGYTFVGVDLDGHRLRVTCLNN
jgi:catechol 2,3-dioxygenase-like lactoylglutathione lyase family enzyme